MSPAMQAMPAREDPAPQLAYAEPAGDDQLTSGAGVAAPQDSYERPDPQFDGPGTSYDRPGATRRAPTRPVQQTYQPELVYQPQSAPPLDPYVDPAANATGPRGSSRRGAGEERYDEVGHAGVRPIDGAGPGAIVAAHATLPPGTFIEVTSLDSGRTILALVAAPAYGGNEIIELSPGAAQLLGASGSSLPVRVRRANASPPDQAALRAGQPASERGDTPPVLLTALRKNLAARGSYAPPSPAYQPPVTRPAPARPGAPRPAARGGNLYVQVAALSNAARAQSLASSLGGFVQSGGAFHRVQLGPFRTNAEAQAARSNAASRGYPDARVFTRN